VAVYLLYLVPLLLEKGDYSLAKKSILECLTRFKRIKRYDALGWAYYKLVQVFLSQDDISQAKKYLDLIGSQNIEFGNEANWIDYKHLAEENVYSQIPEKDMLSLWIPLFVHSLINFGLFSIQI
ncbi:unnamed protein product, partial [marine sediment metagenome]